MNFENELRETMRAHDTDAPSAADLTVPSARQTRHWLPAAAAALVILAIAGTWFAIARTHDSAGSGNSARPAATPPLSCPADFGGRRTANWVPSGPEGVTDPGGRLVPEQSATTAVVCAYLNDAAHLTGEQVLTGGVDAMAATLSLLPAANGEGFACTADLRPTDLDNYLIGLTYDDGGLVWVSAPGNHCAGATNGEFETSTNLLNFVSPAYESSVWPDEPRDDPHSNVRGPCGGFAPGRVGSELIPDTPLSLSICVQGEDRTVTTDDVAELIAELNALPTQPSTMSCDGGPSPTPTAGASKTTTVYSLVFRYAEGPAVKLYLIPNCNPSVFSPGLAANATPEIVNLVQRLLG